MAYDERIQDAIINNLSAAAVPNKGAEVVSKAPMDGRIDVNFDGEGTLCNVTLYAARNGGRPVTVDRVYEVLASHGINTGIDEFDIKDMVTNGLYETPICVARAIPPKRGLNGVLTFRFDRERKIAPKHDDSGVVDFRELDSIIPIRKGEVIADITLPTEGVPGVNIFGKEIPPEPGKPAKVTLGKNNIMTVDGKSVVAACDGHLMYGLGCFNVEDTVTIRSDLDLSVGNLNFFGDIHIKGNVMEGFKIVAGKTVKVDGSVFGSEIKAGGNVSIIGGCINSTIDTEGNVNIGFCENTTINSKGNVESKQFAFCEVFCYGELIAKGPTGVIVGGKITAMRDVTAGIIGSNKYTQTEINIGDGSVLYARKKQAQKELDEIVEVLGQSTRNLEFLKQRREMQGGRLSEAQAKQYKIETQNKIFYNMKKKTLTETIAQLDEEIKNKDILSARCSGVIYPGSHFCINFMTLDVTEIYKKSNITVVGDQLMAVPFR